MNKQSVKEGFAEETKSSVPAVSPTATATKMETVKNTVADKMQQVAGTLHNRADSTADAAKNRIDGFSQLGQQAADKVNEYAQYATDSANKLGHKAADMLDAGADYVRHFEPQKAKTAIQKQFRENPGTSLLIVGAVGFLLGALIARRI